MVIFGSKPCKAPLESLSTFLTHELCILLACRARDIFHAFATSFTPTVVYTRPPLPSAILSANKENTKLTAVLPLVLFYPWYSHPLVNIFWMYSRNK